MRKSNCTKIIQGHLLIPFRSRGHINVKVHNTHTHTYVCIYIFMYRYHWLIRKTPQSDCLIWSQIIVALYLYKFVNYSQFSKWCWIDKGNCFQLTSHTSSCQVGSVAQQTIMFRLVLTWLWASSCNSASHLKKPQISRILCRFYCFLSDFIDST